MSNIRYGNSRGEIKIFLSVQFHLAVAVAVAVVMVVAAVESSEVSALHTEVPANRLHGIAKSAEGAYAAEVCCIVPPYLTCMLHHLNL